MRIALVSLFLLFCHAAFAAPPQGIVGGTNNPAVITPATVGTSAAQLIGAASSGPITVLAIDNESTATIAICFVPTGAASCTPALNTAGSFTIQAGATRVWGNGLGNIPTNAIYAISSAAGTPVTIERE